MLVFYYGKLIFIAFYLDPNMCKVDVTLTSGTSVTMARWFDIWAAAVEIKTMCVDHGTSGTMSYIGKLWSLTTQTIHNFYSAIKVIGNINRLKYAKLGV